MLKHISLSNVVVSRVFVSSHFGFRFRSDSDWWLCVSWVLNRGVAQPGPARPGPAQSGPRAPSAPAPMRAPLPLVSFSHLISAAQ
jgi:hypothetical protein